MTVHLQPLSAGDAAAVPGWPPYTGEFAPLDYALRPGGWLDTFPESATTHRYGIWRDGRLSGFSLLTSIGGGRAEFYIAIRQDDTGQGIAAAAIPLVLAAAFTGLGLDTVYLKVRLWHRHAVALYRRMGFVVTAEKTEEIQGRPVRFLVMEASRPTI